MMIHPPDDDRSLIAASRSGDAEAFGVLVRRYQDRLYPTLLRLTGRAEDAADLLQEAFLKAFLKLKHFHEESSFYTWLYRIAVNQALSFRRRRPRSNALPIELPEPRKHGSDSSLLDPALALEQAERDAQVQDALRTLAPDHRAVVVMKDLDGLRYEEIAEVLNIPVGTVRSRLHRARSELRERLQALIQEEPARCRRH